MRRATDRFDGPDVLRSGELATGFKNRVEGARMKDPVEATPSRRNRDIRRLLEPAPPDPPPHDLRGLSAETSRRPGLLRADGIVRKAAETHRHRLATRDEPLTGVLFATRDRDIEPLPAKAA